MTTDAIIATLMLGVMCAAMWWLARLAKRRMGIGSGIISSGGLRVVGKRPLDQKSSLFVVEIAGGRHILIGTSLDGGISKIDDISAEEYRAMTSDSDAPTAATVSRLRAADTADTGEDLDSESTEQRFATVGESFQHLLGKAKHARTARRDRASGDE